jgi:hypothetical protein
MVHSTASQCSACVDQLHVAQSPEILRALGNVTSPELEKERKTPEDFISFALRQEKAYSPSLV